MNKKKDEHYKAGKIDAFYEVGEALKYDYEGDYSQSSIEDFFDRKAQELKTENNKER